MEKNVLITGATRGLGKNLALYFAEKGYNVIFTYNKNYKYANMLNNDIKKKFNVKTYMIKLDISSEKNVIKALNKVKLKFKKIDILINNAAYQSDDYYFNKTKKDFLKTFEVNVAGTFLMTKYFTTIMNLGFVINISSLDSYDTYSDISMDYCASKAAINSLTQTFSLAIKNIKFISILLPWLNTYSVRCMNQEYLNSELERTKQKKLIEPDIVAGKIYEIINNDKIKSGSIINYYKI